MIPNPFGMVASGIIGPTGPEDYAFANSAHLLRPRGLDRAPQLPNIVSRHVLNTRLNPLSMTYGQPQSDSIGPAVSGLTASRLPSPNPLQIAVSNISMPWRGAEGSSTVSSLGRLYNSFTGSLL